MSLIDMNITNQQLPVIAFNFDEIKSNLQQSMEHYKNLIVTEDSLSICKSQQKELAGIRVKIDGYRKDVKKEMLKPIDEFEDKCKQLVKLVEDVEQPLKEAIQVFDDKKRAEKRQIAEEVIKEMIEKHGLNDEFAAELTVIDKYCNLTASYKDVYEDLEQRAFLALSKQQQYYDMLDILQSTIENANQGNKTQLTLLDFEYMIRAKMPAKDIIAEINKRAAMIKQAEIPKEVPQAPDAPPAPIKQEVKADEPIFFVELRIEDTKANIEALAKFMKESGFNYKTIAKGRV